MAPLPDDRVAPKPVRVAPFDTVGIDAIGPLMIKGKEGLEKRYIILFTCAIYRLLHLEVVADLATDAILMAFARFTARNPRPRKVRSDNGKYFTRADIELNRLWAKIREDRFIKEYPTIEWNFTAPRAPWQGGFYERLVQCTKRSLHAVHANGSLNHEEFVTAVTTVEGILNNRPLGTEPSPHPADPAPITPSMFRTGAEFMDLALMPPDAQSNLLVRMQHKEKSLWDWWNRLVKELLPTYHSLNKSVRDRAELKKGDVVLYLEDRDRGRWPLARIEEVERTERDGKVRNVTLRYKGKLYRRAAASVLLLEAMAPPDLPPPPQPAE